VLQILSDIRHAVRTIVRRPAFAATVVLTLAIGIGANAAIFSVVNGVLLRPLPYPEAENLVSLWTRFTPESGLDFQQFSLSVAEYFDYETEARTMETVAAYTGVGATITAGDGDPERLSGALVTSNLFTLLRAPALLGRALTEQDDQPGSDPVVVLSHALWQRRFGGDAAIVGGTITVNGQAINVVGVMPPGFAFPTPDTQLWAAFQFDESDRDNRGNHFIRGLGRLAPGATLDDVDAELATMMDRWEVDFGDRYTGHFLWTRPYIDDIVGNVRGALWLLLGAVGFVLLIVCANVANLLLAAGEQRRREIAVRVALGAGRIRIFQQLLTESLVLSVAGGALGLTLAALGTRAVLALDAGGIPRTADIRLDGTVLLFTAAVSAVTGLVFGLVPALQATTPDLREAFTEGGRGTTGGRRKYLRQFLVVAETALSILLVIGAGLMVRSFWNLVREDPGFQPHNVLVAQVSLPSGDYQPEQAALFYTELIERVAGIPGVEQASATSRLPMLSGSNYPDFDIEGRVPANEGGQVLNAAHVASRSGYFETMGIPLRRGRQFLTGDREGTMPVAIINETMARRFWPGEDPLGQRIRYYGCEQCAWMTIVGIVGDVKFQGLVLDPPPVYYYAHEQAVEHYSFSNRSLVLTIKTARDPLTVAPAVRAAILELDPRLPIVGLQPMVDVVTRSAARQRFVMTLMGIFAGVALILGAVGIYGVVSYGVAQRTNEIGVRIALGAGRRQVARMVVGQGMRLSLIGVFIGVGGAVAATRIMESLLFNVSSTDPVTFVAVSVLLTVVALFASYVPARRATQVDPMTAIRSE
jgi:putative ABC transport system permease protein